MANSTPEQIPLNEIIQALIGFTTSMLDRFTSLLEKLETDLTTMDSIQLQGEMEELLRMIIQTSDKAIAKLLELQQELQASFIESYFLAQD